MTRTTPASLLAIAAMLLAGPGVPGMPARAAPANQPAASSPALPPDIAARVEQHNKALHDQLQITPQQQALWDRFAAVTLSNAADIGQAFNERGARLDTMTAAENMQSFAHVAQVHAPGAVHHVFQPAEAGRRRRVQKQAGRQSGRAQACRVAPYPL